MPSHFEFKLEDMMNFASFTKAVAGNHQNKTPDGTLKPLKTSLATDPDPQRSLTVWSQSEILQGTAMQKPTGAIMDTPQQSLSADLAHILGDPNIEDGGIDRLLGERQAFAPQDVADLGKTAQSSGGWLSDILNQAQNGTLPGMSSAPPPPPGKTRSTSELRNIWGPACTPQSGLTRLELWSNGAGITVRKETLPIWVAVNDIMKKWQYQLRKADTGAYNCRKITGGSGLSLHSFGIAVDFNWQSNPYGPKLITDMPGGMVEEILSIKTKKSRLTCLRWGGHYSNNKDAMHYEVVVTASEIAEGLLIPGQRTSRTSSGGGGGLIL